VKNLLTDERLREWRQHLGGKIIGYLTGALQVRSAMCKIEMKILKKLSFHSNLLKYVATL